MKHFYLTILLLAFFLPTVSVGQTTNDLSVTKINKNSFNNVGDIITYDIVVSNSGSQVLNDVTVLDPLTSLDEKITLNANQSRTFTQYYKVTQKDIDLGYVKSTASAVYGKVNVAMDNSKQVQFYIFPIDVVVLSNNYNCMNGYAYAVRFAYGISGDGVSDISEFYGDLPCIDNVEDFRVSVSNGSKGYTQSYQDSRSASDCNTINLETLGCENFDITIIGNGIPKQTFSINPNENIYFTSKNSNNTVYKGQVVNNPPTITANNADGNDAYCPGTTVPIAKDVVITDNGGGNLLSAAFIQVSVNYKQGDILSFTNTSKIKGTFNSSEGKMSLKGEATFAEYKAAIESIRFSSSASFVDGLGRGFSIVLNEANYLESTGHYYEYVPNVKIRWDNAKAAAENRTFYGLKGYLATITGPEEAALLGKQAPGAGWIGASDVEVEGVWRWVTGPENGQQFWQGGTPANGGKVITGKYANWNDKEPNNQNNEDYAHITAPGVGPRGSWNDLPIAGTSGNYEPKGYLVEYGGMPGDPVPPKVSATTSLTLEKVKPTASIPTPITAKCKAPSPNIDLVIDEADNCTKNPTVAFVSDDNTDANKVLRTYSITDASGNITNVVQTINIITPTVDAGEMQTICNGDSVTLTSTISNGTAPYIYEWKTGGNVVGTTANITTVPVGEKDNNLNIDYTVTVTDAAGCTFTDDVRVRVKFVPEATATTNSASCGEDNGSITFNFPNKDNRSSIQFSLDGGNTYNTTPDDSGSITYTDLKTGSYNLWARWGNGECAIELGDYNIERKPEVAITDQPKDQKIFVNQDAEFSVSIDNADTFQWQVSKDGGINFIDINDGSEYSGVNTKVLTIVSTDIDKNNYQYRLVSVDSMNGCAPVDSDAAILNVGVRTVITNRNQTYRVNKN
ncbi:hypothetical protein JM658_04605 [Joostella atrarenae]|uniref:C-type lectin domain-containing protein n=1 Tax=Joostella atrarenae TaxID=679257 RepID=A0ABS9J111_9FLAO|nr:hypothetical protein [Joostella atrarenae]MCF8714102.1 hypothetical protein [Joostella atrarenae]